MFHLIATLALKNKKVWFKILLDFGARRKRCHWLKLGARVTIFEPLNTLKISFSNFLKAIREIFQNFIAFHIAIVLKQKKKKKKKKNQYKKKKNKKYFKKKIKILI